MLTIDLFEELEGPPEPTLIDALRDFLPLAVKHLKIKMFKMSIEKEKTDEISQVLRLNEDELTTFLLENSSEIKDITLLSKLKSFDGLLETEILSILKNSKQYKLLGII